MGDSEIFYTYWNLQHNYISQSLINVRETGFRVTDTYEEHIRLSVLYVQLCILEIREELSPTKKLPWETIWIEHIADSWVWHHKQDSKQLSTSICTTCDWRQSWSLESRFSGSFATYWKIGREKRPSQCCANSKHWPWYVGYKFNREEEKFQWQPFHTTRWKSSSTLPARTRWGTSVDSRK